MKATCAFLFFAVVVSAVTLTAADTWYVDCGMEGYEGHDGSSPSLAFETIQEGVDAAASGDTVIVAPGVYGKGARLDAGDDNTVSNRVVIRKALTLKSRDGAAKTCIVGAFDMSNADRVGPAAVRCVMVPKWDVKVLIEGFTITGGATVNADNTPKSWGAGIMATAPQASGLSNTLVVDCVITNNWGSRGAGLYGGTAIRTFFKDNHAVGAGTAMRCGNAFNCIFVEPYSISSSRCSVDSMVNLLNCTLVGCRNAIKGDTLIRNCLVAASPSSLMGGSSKLENFASEPVVTASYVDSGSRNWTGSSDRLLIAPALEDYRPLTGGYADGTGDPSHLECAFVPSEYRSTDFFGRPRTTGGKINLGAIEATVGAKSGCAVFNFSNNNFRSIVVDGHELPSVTTANSYAYAVEYPVQWRVSVVEDRGSTLFSVGQLGCWSYQRYPDENGGFWLTPPGIGSVVTNYANKANLVKWVSPDGDDSYVGDDLGSEAHPYGTLQAAVDAANQEANGVVFAKAGVYDRGGCYLYGATNRVCINRGLRLVAVDGPEKTFIVGAPDVSGGADVVSGCGSNATRCAAVKKDVHGAVIGFTLTGGYGPVGKDMGGGAFTGASSGMSQLIHCIVTNNFGYAGAACYGGWKQRCFFGYNRNVSGNEKGICRAGISSACVYYRNESVGNTAGAYEKCFNCTLYTPNKTSLADSAKCFNSIIHTSAYVPAHSSVDDIVGNVFYKIDTLNQKTGYVLTDPLIVDIASGDLRIRPNSPAIGAGDADVSEFALYAIGGYEGGRLLFADGKTTAGAMQKPVVVVNVTAKTAGDLAPIGLHYLDQGESLTLEATGDVARRFLSFIVDGKPVGAEGARTYAWTAPKTYTPGQVSVSAVYASDWYVNADDTVGDDANDGWTPETPKLTLAASMAHVVAGDTVHAAAGVYDRGDDSYSSPYVVTADACPIIRSRVVVPAGVTLEGEDRETTFIDGKLGDCAGGCGTNALRCVYLAADATVRNFTIRKGRTAPKEAADYQDDNYFGGGVRGLHWFTSKVEDCILTDCCAPRGGALIYAYAKNCRIVANNSLVNGSAARCTTLHGCYISGNTGTSPTISNIEFVNCSYAGDNTGNISSWDSTGRSRMMNCVVFTSSSYALTAPKTLTNVVFIGSIETHGTVNDFNTRRFDDAEAAKIGADGHLLADSPLIDAGDNAAVVDWETDVDGGQRIYNGTVDVGCYEYDWRPRFAAAIGGGVRLDRVSPSVTLESASGKVTLSDGDFLSGVWAAAGGMDRKTSFAATAEAVNGRLAGIFACEEPAFSRALEAEDGNASVRFKLKCPALKFEFAYAGRGCGALFDFASSCGGAVLLIR